MPLKYKVVIDSFVPNARVVFIASINDSLTIGKVLYSHLLLCSWRVLSF